jgi:hypothetical protein
MNSTGCWDTWHLHAWDHSVLPAVELWVTMGTCFHCMFLGCQQEMEQGNVSGGIPIAFEAATSTVGVSPATVALHRSEGAPESWWDDTDKLRTTRTNRVRGAGALTATTSDRVEGIVRVDDTIHDLDAILEGTHVSRL